MGELRGKRTGGWNGTLSHTHRPLESVKLSLESILLSVVDALILFIKFFLSSVIIVIIVIIILSFGR